MNVGLDQVIAAARDLGIDAPISPVPSLALGAASVPRRNSIFRDCPGRAFKAFPSVTEKGSSAGEQGFEPPLPAAILRKPRRKEAGPSLFACLAFYPKRSLRLRLGITVPAGQLL
jgi:hypothetical protein